MEFKNFKFFIIFDKNNWKQHFFHSELKSWKKTNHSCKGNYKKYDNI